MKKVSDRKKKKTYRKPFLNYVYNNASALNFKEKINFNMLNDEKNHSPLC